MSFSQAIQETARPKKKRKAAQILAVDVNGSYSPGLADVQSLLLRIFTAACSQDHGRCQLLCHAATSCTQIKEMSLRSRLGLSCLQSDAISIA